MKVTVRLSDDLTAEIDRIAAANGQTRSSWITKALTIAAVSSDSQDVPLMPVQGRGHPDDYIRVTVRLNRSEMEAIDTVAAPMRLTRNEWIKRTIRWQLWDKAALLRLAPVTQTEIGKVRKQVLAIGRNINQAVHAMNAANQPESSLDIARIAGTFLETCGDLRSLLIEARRSLASSIGGEIGYWTRRDEGQGQ
ncbi:ribbon-helix-helix protein, CopG family [Sphingomonas faeni]|uniref:ribbon-helix-helix protein, CopG family n=1 Tax=Sphingomonas faeni TaxID=185950 RepID=UPI0020C79C1D|nr:ribbon-helix-helix protein, CopG family [Sphingomonas faeni]MCP8891610.1 ribbon-helix-helix domain-containing protein [Sphingomonas faeni]